MLLRVAEDFGFRIATLQHVLEGYKVAEVIAKHGAGASTFSDWWAYKFEVYDAIPYNGALMEKVGVVTSFNSDSDELARRLNLEAAKAVKYGGLSEEEALKLVTINPAKQLKIDKYVGSLEPGKHADFVIWSGNPLSTYTICEQTWIDGRKYFDRNEDLKMREEIKKQRTFIIQKIFEVKSSARGPQFATQPN
jgi:imidazolonepropionase-like amidohydrolase